MRIKREKKVIVRTEGHPQAFVYLNGMSLLEGRAQSHMAGASIRALVDLALLGNASSFMRLGGCGEG